MTTLLPWQQDSFREMLNALVNHRICADMSQTGTGKTYKACAVAHTLGYKMLVICPKAMIPEWEKVAKSFDVECTAINYERVRIGNTKWGMWTYSNRIWKWTLEKDTLLVFDEAHRLGGQTSLNAKLLVAAKREGVYTLLLSATLADSPLRMKAIGFALDLHNHKDYFSWLFNNGVKKDFYGKMTYFGGEEGMAKIRSDFKHVTTQIKISELGDKFPNNQVSTLTVPVKGNPDTHYLKDIRELKDSASTQVIEMLRSRQEVELMKMNAITELANDYVDQGNSVVVFVNFKATIECMRDNFKRCAVIYGGQNEDSRREQIELFQENEIHVLLCMIQAGGVGLSLHDLKGRPRVSLINPGWSATELVQTLGRIHRTGGKSPAIQRIIFAENSKIESRIQKTIERKLSNLQGLTNDDLMIVKK